MKSRLKILIILIFCIMSRVVISQEHAYFENYTTKDGLNANMIYYLTQDKNGFIWGTTNNGLFRFDGHHFKRFNIENYPEIHRNDLKRIGNHSDGQIITGGYSGTLVLYDEKRDSFEDKTIQNFYQTYFKEIKGVSFSSHGDEYVFTSGGIYLYDKDKKKFTEDFPSFEALKNIQVYSMNIDRFDRFWIGTINELKIYDKNGTLLKEEKLKTGMKTFVSNVTKLEENLFLVSFMQKGLWLFDIKDDGSINGPHSISTPFHNVTFQMKDRNGRIWFATDGEGLWYSDSITEGSFIQVSPYNEVSGFEMKKIYSLLEDRVGDIWVSTHNSGLWKYPQKQLHGIILSQSVGFPSSIVTSLHSDGNGNMLIGTDGAGLYLFSSNCKILRHWTTADGLSSNNVLSITGNKENGFELGTWGGGMCHFDILTETFSPCLFPNISSPSNRCGNILITKNEEIIVSTNGDGIYLCSDGIWNRKKLQIEDGLDDWMLKSTEGKNAVVWSISSDNLWRLDGTSSKPMLQNKNRSKEHNPLSFHDIACDADGNCLLATDRGVYWFSGDGKRSEKLDYIPRGFYTSVLFDKKGLLWLSGSNGIISADLKEKTCCRIWYDDVLCMENYFSFRSSCQNEDGKIYFGTKDGFLMFSPDEIRSNPVIDYLAFDELLLSGKKVKPGSGVLSSGHLSQLKCLKLEQEQTNISISFNWVDFSRTKDIICQYCLIGMNKDWISLDSKERVVRFSYIPSGKYDLQIRLVGDKDGNVLKSITLKLEVLPPWWANWWFRTGTVLLLSLVVFLIIRTRFKYVKKRNRELERKVRLRTEELYSANKEILSQNKSLKEQKFMIELKNKDITDALKDKDRLISVIAHDLRNPMFAIVRGLEELRYSSETISPESRISLVKELSDSSARVQSELDKLLKWVSSQGDELSYAPQNTDMSLIIKDCISFLEPISKEKDIRMMLESAKVSDAFVDARMVSVVIRNLLANSLKFTSVGGEIILSVHEEAPWVIVRVKDNGVGMDGNQLDSLFVNAQSTLGTENEVGSGLGMRLCKRLMDTNKGIITAESEVGKGSLFTLFLPMATDVKESDPKSNINKELLSGSTVLVVDDDNLTRRYIRKTLEKFLFVIDASDGRKALELLKSNEPDIILSDIEMPNMDGFDFCREVQKSDNLSHIPFLFLTAKDSPKNKLTGLKSGAIDYLSKPFNEEELLVTLTNILTLKQNQQRRILLRWFENTAAEDAEGNNGDPMLKKMMEIIELNYNDSEFSVKELFEQLYISKSTLIRKVKSLTGKTPNAVINEFRLYKAKYLLKNSQMNISDIAYEVGFNDPHYFCRKYKEFFGGTPSAMKNSK